MLCIFYAVYVALLQKATSNFVKNFAIFCAGAALDVNPYH